MNVGKGRLRHIAPHHMGHLSRLETDIRDHDGIEKVKFALGGQLANRIRHFSSLKSN